MTLDNNTPAADAETNAAAGSSSGGFYSEAQMSAADKAEAMRLRNASAILDKKLETLRPYLDREGVTELVINKPKQIGLEMRGGWTWHKAEELDYEYLMALAVAAAAFTKQEITAKTPICSTVFPTGERVQIVMPPVTDKDTVSFTIRKPSSKSMSLEEFANAGLFKDTVIAKREISPLQKELLQLLQDGKHVEFFRLAVRSRLNILISGATGSGKTTFSKGLILEIPEHERILTIEDTRELEVPHENKLHMVYSKDGQGLAAVSAKNLLESALRMRPDRILLQELRDGTAFYYIRNVNSGHPGSITTIHADSAEGAFEQLALLVKESQGGADLKREEVLKLVKSLVDVVVQMTKVNGEFRAPEIYYDPNAKFA